MAGRSDVSEVGQTLAFASATALKGWVVMLRSSCSWFVELQHYARVIPCSDFASNTPQFAIDIARLFPDLSVAFNVPPAWPDVRDLETWRVGLCVTINGETHEECWQKFVSLSKASLFWTETFVLGVETNFLAALEFLVSRCKTLFHAAKQTFCASRWQSNCFA